MPLLGFPAGEVIHSLIGFENKGDQEFVITQIEGSLRFVGLYGSVCLCMCVRTHPCVHNIDQLQGV